MGVNGLGTVLGVWAHPDDEAYLMAGTALAAAATGSHVACLTATAGEAGESSDESRWPQRELGSIRRRELDASLAILGIADHTWLDLPDGGLAGVDGDVGTGMVADVIDRVRPDTILTFGADGVTGHPDHVAVGAWALAAAARVRPECRVLAVTKTPAWLSRFATVNDGLFDNERPCTEPEDLALEVRLDQAAMDRKFAALRAQASQTTGLIEHLGEATYREWLSDEYWVERVLATRRP